MDSRSIRQRIDQPKVGHHCQWLRCVFHTLTKGTPRSFWKHYPILTEEIIKIEIGMREPLILPSLTGETHTIVVNPFSGRPLLPIFGVQAMDMKEAYAEKARAAMTRRKPAIRDLFDLFYTVRKMKLDLDDRDFVVLVKQKLDVPGNIPVDISIEYKEELVRQVEGQLRPVLRPADFDGFNLDEAFEMIARIAGTLSG